MIVPMLQSVLAVGVIEQPVRITDRLGLQLDVVQNAFVNRVPSAASASMFGVLITELP